MPKHDDPDPFDREMIASMPPPDLIDLSFQCTDPTRPKSLADQLRDQAISRIGLDPCKVRTAAKG